MVDERRIQVRRHGFATRCLAKLLLLAGLAAAMAGCAGSSESAASVSGNQQGGKVPYSEGGMPAAMGVVPMNQSSVEKNGWSLQIATRSRPVAARASLTAVSTRSRS